eukprot:TRINITY_DN4876_c0_g1_i1.p1 TRINITY_DN4876_c0_g1~~TRINITY_DN4876_c0_g1_i1.p1  ORF type:complete len:255 (+),score=35.39 TRINITY_DN4876_c0_g1_i1:316-1080(+)
MFEELFRGQFGGAQFGGAQFGGFSGFGGFGGPRKAPTLKQNLSLTLEEFYMGCTKTVRVSRQIGNHDTDVKTFHVKIEPGYHDGIKLRYANDGHQLPGMTPGDLLFVLQEKPHSTFKRQNKNNLVYTAEISLKHALLGAKLVIPMLNGKKEEVNVAHVIEPNFVKTVRGLGMPIHGYNGSFGDLIIQFKILFPKELSEAKKKEVAAVFDGVEFVKSGPSVLEAVAEKFRFGLEALKPLVSWLFVLFIFIWMGRR